MGVLRVDSLPELMAAYDKVLDELAAARKAAIGTADYRATVATIEAKMVLEEFLDGEEQARTLWPTLAHTRPPEARLCELHRYELQPQHRVLPRVRNLQ